MKRIQVKENIEWLPLPNESHVYLSSELPPGEQTTAAFIFLFREDSILLTNLNSRGWDLPGGHIEAGETAFDAMKRELQEETGAIFGYAELIGYEQLIIRAPRPTNYAYPYPESYLAFYWGRIEGRAEVEANAETSGTGFFTYSEALRIPWIQHNGQLFEAAFHRHKNMR